MPHTNPANVTDFNLKNLLEGTRYSTSAEFIDQTVDTINLYIQARHPNHPDGYIVVSPVVYRTGTTIETQTDFNPQSFDLSAGEELDVTRRRRDSVEAASSAYQNVTFSNPEERAEERIIFAGTNKVGSNTNVESFLVPSGTDIVFDVAQISGTANQATVNIEVFFAEVEETVVPILEEL